MYIVGSGLAGLITAAINQEAVIFEPKTKPTKHRAVLRFRTPDIGIAIGIPFKEVTVYKGIWHNDQPVALSPRYINLYSRKVADNLSNRSICNINKETRWIAPDDLHEQLLETFKHRIESAFDIKRVIHFDTPGISTLPIQVMADLIGYNLKCSTKPSQKVFIKRLKIPDSNVYQTYYYTDPTVNVYRASITKDVLIIESMWTISNEDVNTVVKSFGLQGMDLEDIGDYEQQIGKIVPIDEATRRAFILHLTLKYNIFSLGRYATWRNLVLDDVYKDALRIKQMMSRDEYEAFRRIHNES